MNLDAAKFLVPSLLPLADMSADEVVDWREPSTALSTCVVVFTIYDDYFKSQTTINQQDLSEWGFLPSGLFERIVCRAVVWCQNTSTSSGFDLNSLLLYRDMAVICFGRQRFRLTYTSMNCIRVDIEGTNPLSVHERLLSLMRDVIDECMKSLKCFTALFHTSNADGAINNSEYDQFCGGDTQTNLLLIPLEQLRHTAESRTVLNKKGGRRLLSDDDIRKRYKVWLQIYELRDNYDVFISYRWNLFDNKFVLDLFDMFTNHSVGAEQRAVEVFLDKKRLKDGRPYDKDFARGLINSNVIVTVVSIEALQRIVTHDPYQVDNMLVEWILALFCYNSPSLATAAVLPILFGPRRLCEAIPGDILTDDLFRDGILKCIPKIVPTASISKAASYLFDFDSTLVVPTAMLEKTLDAYIEDLLKFQSVLVSTLPPTAVVELSAQRVVNMLSDTAARKPLGTVALSPHTPATPKPTNSISPVRNRTAVSNDGRDWLAEVLAGEFTRYFFI